VGNYIITFGSAIYISSIKRRKEGNILMGSNKKINTMIRKKSKEEISFKHDKDGLTIYITNHLANQGGIA
jgi:hypothetical protein